MGMMDKFIIAGYGFNLGVFWVLSLRSWFENKEHVICLILSFIAVGLCIWS